MVETVVQDGDPADSITAYAIKQGVDLIAMATHGRHGLDRLLFGSVTEAVLRHTVVPLLLHHIVPGEISPVAVSPELVSTK